MKRHYRIEYLLALLISSFFVVVSCDNQDPGPTPDMVRQQNDLLEGTDELPDFYVELSSASPGSATVQEGESFALQVLNPSEVDQDIDVNLSFSGAGEYGEDFTILGADLKSVDADGAIITISKSLKIAEFTVAVLRDGVTEGDESVTVSLESATAADGTEFTVDEGERERFSATITIENNPTIATIAESEFEVTVSKNRTVIIPVVLDMPAITETTLTYDLTNESGQVGDLYSDLTGGSITFEEGETEKNIRVFIEDAAFDACNDLILKVSIAGSVITGDDNDVEISTSDNESIITIPLEACPNLTYCDSKADTQADEWIQRFVLGSIDNNSGVSGDYADFTNLSTALQRGSTENVFFQAGYSSILWSEAWNLWIDLNQDGDFDDAGEKLLNICCTADPSLLATTITIPASASLGATRLRFTMSYNGTVGPCDDFTFGEVEDYTVIITDSPTDANETPINGSEVIDLGSEDDILFLKTDGVSNSDKFDVLINNIDTSEPIQIYNTANDLVKSVDAEGERTTINTSDLPKGNYTIQAQAGGKTVSAEFVVK
ncbi:Por secretion system C-terminal sorting domain-containing protein [Marivirga sericea]|uniref:Por secretion system C-terminal sorting domain-containing protein n=1 Tax=Marivirga sericea TaxID=1028 RepID=A0A1X7L3L1_9BACT|nr:GEVED domain-containing protein [Marivirga sericea]SMG48446.1 Por secretion system C-terminal sorting domain-containing protein [Marivirga sericea]